MRYAKPTDEELVKSQIRIIAELKKNKIPLGKELTFTQKNFDSILKTLI